MRCTCGCGTPVTKLGNKYVWGHNLIVQYGKRFKKGQTPWNKGKPSPLKGTKLSPEQREKASKTFFKPGKNHPMFGKYHTLETKRKMSASHTGIEHSLESRLKMSKNRKGIKFTPEHRANMSKVRMGKTLTFKHKEKIRKASTALWYDVEYTNKMKISRHIKPNKEEIRLLKILKAVSDDWMFVGDWKIFIGGKCPDFWNGKFKVIEYNGSYWHKDDDSEERIKYFKNRGFETLILWDYEFANIDKVKSKILNFNC